MALWRKRNYPVCEQCGRRQSSILMTVNGKKAYLCGDCAYSVHCLHMRIRKNGDKHRAAIFKRDGYRCVKCGATTNLTLDHIKPIALGGTSDYDNLQTLCATCNYGKADRRIGV